MTETEVAETTKQVDSGSDSEPHDISAIQPIRKRKKRTAPDESLLEEDEKLKLEQRRAYNRACAAKARKRSKDLIATLQKQVEDLTRDKSQLERTNDVMRAQLDLLEQQNRTLMATQRVPQFNAAPPQMMAAQAQPQQMGMVQAGQGGPIYIAASGAPYAAQPGQHYIEVQQQQQQQQQPAGVPAGAVVQNGMTHMARSSQGSSSA